MKVNMIVCFLYTYYYYYFFFFLINFIIIIIIITIFFYYYFCIAKYISLNINQYVESFLCESKQNIMCSVKKVNVFSFFFFLIII